MAHALLLSTATGALPAAVIPWKQCPAYGSIDSEHLEVVARHHMAEHHPASHAGEGEAVETEHLREAGVLFAEILQFLPGEPVSVAVGLAPGELIQAIRLADIEGLQDIGIEEGKHRRVQTETERDGCYNGQRETRSTSKPSESIPRVLPQRLEQIQPARVATFFFHLLEPAKVEACAE